MIGNDDADMTARRDTQSQTGAVVTRFAPSPTGALHAGHAVAAIAAHDRAREGGGPTLIECHTMRMHGHGAHDDMSYVPAGLFEEWAARDPIDLYRRRLVEKYGFSEAGLDDLRSVCEREVAEAALLWEAETMGVADSGLPGPKGNREFFVHLSNREDAKLPPELDDWIADAVG